MSKIHMNTEGNTGKPQDRSRLHLFQGLETVLAEYLLCDPVAPQEIMKVWLPTTWSGCFCIFLTAVSSSDIFLCGACGIRASNKENLAHKGSKEEICVVPAFGQGLLAQGGQGAFPGAANSSSRMVTAGEEPQTSETQHHLASTGVLQMGSV